MRLQFHGRAADGIGAMVPFLRSSPFLLCLFAAVGCSTANHVADFAQNDLFYVDVPFVTKAPGDRPVFVAPVVDARAAATLPASERGFPITYSGDDFWERPVPDMVGDVLTRQLVSSQLFTTVDDHASPEGLVLQPQLVTFLGGATEAISGSRTFAEIGLRVQVYGPAAAGGKRPLLHEQVYGNRQVSQLELNPVSPYRLVGRSLQLTMSKLLSGLDGSNVARSNMPVEVTVPAEASAKAR